MSTNATSQQLIDVEVTQGPNTPDILHSFQNAYSSNTFPVTFTIQTRLPDRSDVLAMDLRAIINSVRYESGAPGMLIIGFRIIGQQGWTSGEGFYNANTRRGTLNLKR